MAPAAPRRAAVVGLRGRRAHWLYWLAAANVLAFLGLNVLFTGWHGGSCLGPRYQIPVLPFYVLLGALLPEILARYGRPRWAAGAVAVVMLGSGLNMLVAAAVSPMTREYAPGVPAAWQNPLATYYVGLFRHGSVHLGILGKDAIRVGGGQDRRPPPAYPTFNLGELVGLPRAWSLLPWLGVTVLLGGCLWRTARYPRPAAGPPG